MTSSQSACQLSRQSRGHGFKSCKGQNFFQVSFQLLVQQCSQLRGSLVSYFFTTVHEHDFHIFPVIIIHLLEGLFGSNFMSSSQLAFQLSWQSAAPVSQRSWVQIPYGPEFFPGLISTSSSVVFIAARIACISELQWISHYHQLSLNSNNVFTDFFVCTIQV